MEARQPTSGEVAEIQSIDALTEQAIIYKVKIDEVLIEMYQYSDNYMFYLNESVDVGTASSTVREIETGARSVSERVDKAIGETLSFVNSSAMSTEDARAIREYLVGLVDSARRFKTDFEQLAKFAEASDLVGLQNANASMIGITAALARSSNLLLSSTQKSLNKSGPSFHITEASKYVNDVYAEVIESLVSALRREPVKDVSASVRSKISSIDKSLDSADLYAKDFRRGALREYPQQADLVKALAASYQEEIDSVKQVAKLQTEYLPLLEQLETGVAVENVADAFDATNARLAELVALRAEASERSVDAFIQFAKALATANER